MRDFAIEFEFRKGYYPRAEIRPKGQTTEIFPELLTANFIHHLCRAKGRIVGFELSLSRGVLEIIVRRGDHGGVA